MAQKKVTVAADKKKTVLQASAEKPAKAISKPATPKPAAPKQEPAKPVPPDAKNPVAPAVPAKPVPSAREAKKDAPSTPPPQPQPVVSPKPQPQSPQGATEQNPASQLQPPTQPVQQQLPTFGMLFPKYDVFSFSGPMFYPTANVWSKIVREANRATKNKKVFVFFCSGGGSPDEAFRMMRLLQRTYEEINVVIFGQCYSAATLFALGANKIFMGEDAQLGPLDIQIYKDDDLGVVSGECYRQALITLNSLSSMALQELFVKLKKDMGFPVSTTTASRTAAEIVSGIFAPITQQIEPAKLGEVMRAQGICRSYGKRLMKGKYDPELAEKITFKLACQYSSHSTVIDFEEAKSLGLSVEDISVETFCGGLLKKFSEGMIEQGNKTFINFIRDQNLPQ